LRDFVDAILAAIGTSSLTDEEFGWLTTESAIYTLELYNDLVTNVLNTREEVSNVRDRLTYLFKAHGVLLTEGNTPPVGTSKIYLGDAL
jgi:hypothetical protein